MKLKNLFYSTSKLWGFHRQYFTLKGWLRFKDHILLQKRFQFLSRYGIKLQPKRRHRRSVAIRNLKRLYGFTISDLLLPIEFPKRLAFPHGIGYKQYLGRRLYIFYFQEGKNE